MDSFFDDEDPTPNSHQGVDAFTSLRPSSPHSYLANASHDPSSRPDTSSHRHETSSRRADTSSRRGAADTSSLARGRTPDLSLDEILHEMNVDHDGPGGVARAAERSVVRLQRCLANEQGTPELLRFPVELVEAIVTDLAARVSTAARIDCGWQGEAKSVVG